MNPTRWLLRGLGRRLPHLDGTVRAGVGESVTVRRDGFGVPHIAAESDEDAWFGLGFCQGQDRAFQIETRIRVVRGTLSALIGADGLAIDRLARRIGFHRYGEAAATTLEPSERASLEAFAAGVRAGVGIGGGGRSHEFLLLRSRPTPFTAADALGFLAVQAFALASNWDVELARLRMLALDGPDAVRDLHPAYPADHPASDRPGEKAGRVVDALADDLAAASHLFHAGGGSNNWAIAGSRTRSGRPILANDPHLAPVLPAHWYLAHLTTPSWSMVGATVPATPLFGAGHNGHAAWGVTAGMIDTTDLFVEEVGSDGHSVRREDAFVPCAVRIEHIAVKGADDETMEVLVTDRGPIVGPAFTGPFGALSMSATWLRPASLGAGFRLGTIRSFADLRACFADWPAVPLNIAYADATGQIGWQLIGEAPVRGRGSGTIPQDAADPGSAWNDTRITTRDLPHVADPAIGFVATANNLPTTSTHLGSDFLDGYRVARISERLAGRRDWDVPATLQLQMDRVSLPWREMRPIVLAALGEHPSPAARLLVDWDGVVGADSPGAAVFEVFVTDLARRVAGARAPRSADIALGEGFTPLVPFSTLAVRRVSHLIGLMRIRPDGWFAEGWDAAIAASVDAAEALLRDRAGDDPREWAWGRVRTLRLRHPLGMRPPLDRVYDIGPLPLGGDANTVNPAPVDPTDPLTNPDFAIASLRFAVEAGAWEHARFVLPGGQSGNPFSPHYRDQVALWQRGDAFTIPWTDAEVHRSTRHRLHLETQ